MGHSGIYPIADCIIQDQQKKKKAAIPQHKTRSKVLSVVLLKEIPATIPKGLIRERMIFWGGRREWEQKEPTYDDDCTPPWSMRYPVVSWLTMGYRAQLLS